ncbi:MAG TPA: serine/threonine-protein kinase [Vicinamibacterales bacterium]|jgi:serine/threonine-protein kinase|nr:serine/threonine-protein kinase [Vicinamibacterales bacterium]
MIGKTLGKYRIIERLGRGGMGTVYKGIDETLDREVAIKVLNADLDDTDILKRFRGEAVTLARLNHPSIATIYELYRDDDQLLMVMEFVRGETVHDFAERMGPLAAPQAAHLAMQVLDALSHAHRGGVIHRDLKPANLMITETGAVKVMDFGIARVLGTERFTHGGYMMGTPAYMAPEQVLGGEVDGRADLYAVGVLLYRLLTGKLPFNADTAMAMVQKQVNEVPIPIAEIAPHLPPWCSGVMTRALAKSPADRYQTADEFRVALLSAVQPQSLGELPTVATPTPPGLMIGSDITQVYAPAKAARATSGELRPHFAGGAVATAAAAAPSIAATIPAPTPTGTKALDRTTTTVVLGRNHLFAIGGVFLVLIAGVAILSFAALRRNILPAQFQFGAVGSNTTSATPPPTSAPAATPAPPPAEASAQPGSSPPASSAPAGAPAPLPGTQGTTATPATPTTTSPALPGAAPNAAAQKTPTPVVPGAKTPGTTVATAGSVQPGTKADGRGTISPTDNPANAATVAGRGARGGQPPAAATTPAVPPPAPSAPAITPPTPPAVPHAGSSLPPVTFKDVRVLVTSGGKTSEVAGVLTLADGRVQVNGKDGGSALVSLPYQSISAAYFSRSKQPKWKDAEGKDVEGKVDLGKLGFLRSDRNWVILLSHGEPVVLRIDDSGMRTVLPALQDHTGVKIQR